ncbi:peptidoglycan bridge formation glycyltransferase FemA/FemB family protein [Candidatus Saccharibacteria bacterium]|nr:peptidoglycan bridge formation glycyltransferase FemA/FemB family protein [Candidatus Saccharibacteria bacterium]
MSKITQHFLQSPAWQEFQESEGRQTFRLNGSDFDALAILTPTKLGNYLFVPYGPSVASKIGLNNALEALRSLGTQKNAIFIRIEPLDPLEPSQIAHFNLKKTKNIEPQATQILDLTPPADTILKNFSSTNRNRYRNYAKKGLSTRTSKNPDDIAILADLLKGVSANNHFTPHAASYLKNQLKFPFATLYIADYTDENQKKTPIAASLVYDDSTTRYYAHAAADYAHRKLSPGNIIVAKMIMDAKDIGKQYFDFWGITLSEDKTDPWYGFTEFKRSFGGTPKIYAGTYDLVINSAKYHAYTALRMINRSFRTFSKR